MREADLLSHMSETFEETMFHDEPKVRVNCIEITIVYDEIHVQHMTIQHNRCSDR